MNYVLKNVPCPTNKAQDPKPAFKSVQARPPNLKFKKYINASHSSV